jgi:hypothetical protein
MMSRIFVATLFSSSLSNAMRIVLSGVISKEKALDGLRFISGAISFNASYISLYTFYAGRFDVLCLLCSEL